MSQPQLEVSEVARRVLERNLTDRTPAEATRSIEAAFTQLYELMSPVVGSVGFSAVLDRAHHLTLPRCPCLEGVSVRVSTSLDAQGLSTIIESEGVEAVLDCMVALLENVIVLHCRFIGEGLTFRLIRRAWTDFAET